MARLVILIAVVLGSLASFTQSKAMDAEEMGRCSLQLVGLIVTAFLFDVALKDVAFNDVTKALFSGRWRRKGAALAEHPGLGEFANAAPRSASEPDRLADLS